MSVVAVTNPGGINTPAAKLPTHYGMVCTPSGYYCLDDADALTTDAQSIYLTSGLISTVYNNPANSAPIPAKFFGSHNGTPASRNVELSCGTYRIHDSAGCNWRAVNPSSGVYNWASLDAAVAALAGKDIIYTIVACPDWAVTAAAVGGAAYGGKSNMAPDAGTLSTFVSALAARYAGQIKYYEVWNEIQDTRYWAGTSAQIASLTRQAYQAIKAADAAAKVLVGTCTGWNTGGPASTALSAFLAASDGAAGTGATWAVDGLAMHSYNQYPNQGDYALVHQRYANARAALTAGGVSTTVPIMDTEWGFNGVVPGIVTWSWRALPYATRVRLLMQQYVGMWAAQMADRGATTCSCYYREDGAMGWSDTDTSDWAYVYNLLTTRAIVRVNYLSAVRRYAIKFADNSGVIA